MYLSFLKRKIAYVLILASVLLCVFNGSSITAKADNVDFSPIFDAVYYADNNPDLYEAYEYNEAALFNHFIILGMKEGRQASEEFDVTSYKARYFDLVTLYGDKLELYYYHYLFYGKAEGRDGSKDDSLTEKTIRKNSLAYKKALATVTLDDVKQYYDSSVFVGDSIMVGFQYYAGTVSESSVSASEFLAAKSFAVVHAISSVSEDEHQPVYNGVKLNVWDHLAAMPDNDKVFLMFGTNDLVMFTPDRTISRYDILMDKIRETRPDIEIYIISMTSTYPGAGKNNLNNLNIAYMNSVLEMQAPFKNYKFVDLNSYVTDEKYDLIPELSSDKYVHHTIASYKTIWEKVFYNFAADEIAKLRMTKREK